MSINSIATPIKAYREMASKWELPLALWGGTARMRNESSIWLPQLPEEDKQLYENRVSRSFLFNVYKRTIQAMVGHAFSNNITISGVPEELEYLEWNSNGQGQSLTENASELFSDLLLFGKAHTYVDFPSTNINNVSNIEYKKLGLKPYFARVSPINLIGWDLSYNNGYENLNHIRILDSDVQINMDTWEEEERTVIRLITPEYISLYSRAFSSASKLGSGDFELIGNPIENSLGYIPLQTAYANKTGTLLADPTLEDLAWLNLQHFQSSSDQQNILHIARVPFILASGFEEKDAENMTISANHMTVTANKDAKMSYVEHTGAAIDSGREHGKDIEEQMNKIGAEILFSKTVARQTTSNRKMDQAEALSVSQRSLRSLEQMLEQSYEVAADWLDVDVDFEPEVNIGSDLDLATVPNPVEGFVGIANAFGLTPERMLEEAKRWGLLAKHITLKDINITEESLANASTNLTVESDSTQDEPETE